MKFAKRLHLIRHAESVANQRGLLGGMIDFDLTDMGVLQARQAVAPLELQIDKVFTSPLSRAVATAKSMFPGRGFLVAPELAEINMGSYSELTYDDFYRRHPELSEIRKFPGFRFPGGETMIEAQSRATQFVRDHQEELSDSNVVVLAHGGILNLVLLNLLELPLAHYPLVEFQNCRWTSLSFFEGKYRILGVNRVSHD